MLAAQFDTLDVGGMGGEEAARAKAEIRSILSSMLRLVVHEVHTVCLPVLGTRVLFTSFTHSPPLPVYIHQPIMYADGRPHGSAHEAVQG